jgi:hypothetical protein
MAASAAVDAQGLELAEKPVPNAGGCESHIDPPRRPPPHDFTHQLATDAVAQLAATGPALPEHLAARLSPHRQPVYHR